MRRFKCYRQLEKSDCGMTCIRMISAYYGKRVSRRTLEQSSDMSRIGMSVLDMIECMKRIRLNAAAEKTLPVYTVSAVA
ncbi:MAG: hypothetical protein K2J70_07620 [Muribaculaceae bacterium]|nr:hypothetical protein [Muribaculaceae bacterium]